MKTECKNCKTKFEQERTNQIYCSNSCKQKAFKKRKGENLNKTKTNENNLKFTLSDFYHAQNEVYNYYGDKDESFDLDPIMYFFLIQTYNSNDVKKKTEYIISLSAYGRINYSRFRKMQEFLEFEKKYLAKEFEIID